MKIIEGGGDPAAHMESRIAPVCDFCGQQLRGRLPRPWWIAAQGHVDEAGHPHPAGAVRIYACREHRAALASAQRRGATRARDRSLRDQSFLNAPRLRSVDPLPE